jgi:hypothetical protein
MANMLSWNGLREALTGPGEPEYVELARVEPPTARMHRLRISSSLSSTLFVLIILLKADQYHQRTFLQTQCTSLYVVTCLYNVCLQPYT